MAATVGVSFHDAKPAADDTLGALQGGETLAVASNSADTAGAVTAKVGGPSTVRIAAIGADVYASLATSPDAGTASKRLLVAAGREVILQASAGEKVSARLVV